MQPAFSCDNLGSGLQPSPSLTVYEGDNLEITPAFQDGQFRLIYIDPPFNTGHVQARRLLKTVQDPSGDRIGYKGQRYRSIAQGAYAYKDTFDDYAAFIVPRMNEAYRMLAEDGSFFFHIDYRESHYCKILLDEIFGRACFMNEIIWSYDYGARTKKRWSNKHDSIFWYAKNPENYVFNYDAIDRIPYLAPGLVGKEKAARGKTPTDVWWNTIVSPNGKEKTGYPTQKPLKILSRIVNVHSAPGDNLLDFFAGSGSFGEAAIRNNRNAVLVESNAEALTVMRNRFKGYENVSFF